MGKDLIVVVAFENICRLCLHSTDAMSDIFPSSRKTSLQQQIFYITGLATKKGDGLPSKICHRCRYIVEQASELRDVVEKSQKILAKTVLKPSHRGVKVVKEAEPEPFDNDTFLQSLTDTNDSTENIAEQNSPEQISSARNSPEPQYSELNSPEEQFSEANSPEEQFSAPNSPEDQHTEPNSPEEQHTGPNSPEEQHTESNSPREQYNMLNTVFLPDNVDHTMEITAEEVVEEEEHPRNKKSKIPHTCQLCNKQFASTEEVRPHVLQHYAGSEHLQIYLDIESSPYLCTVCDEVQENKARLLKHHRKHLGINPSRCPVPGCQYVGANPGILRRHRSVHDVRKRRCDLCHKIFYRRDLLLRHIAKIHPSTVKPKAPDTAKEVVTEIEPYRVGSRWFTREEGHFYVICRQRNETASLRCHREGCPARFTMKRAHSGPVLEEHNHPPTPWIPSRNRMFQALKRRTTEENIPLSTIYKEESVRYPAAVPHLPFSKVAPSMRKWRRAARPDEDPWGRIYVEDPDAPPAENPEGRVYIRVEQLNVRTKENHWGRDYDISELS